MIRSYKTGYRCVFAMVAGALLIAPARAQQGNIQSLRFYSVKADRAADFEAATKEYKTLAAKAGSDRSFTLWRSLTGPLEYVRVDFYTKWADLDFVPDPKLKDQAADMQSITIRILRATENSRRIVTEVQPDLSLPQSGELPVMIRVLRTQVRPDKVNEYRAQTKSEVLPSVKKAGLKFFSISQARYGAPASEFMTVAGFDSWADLGGGYGVEKAMGPEGYQRYLTAVGQLVVEREFNIYRLVAESSYLPAAPAR
jgi:hypothetical protein